MKALLPRHGGFKHRVSVAGAGTRGSPSLCQTPGVIVTELRSSADPATIHELLVDVESWSVWSPHVASVEADDRRVGDGWEGVTRAFFSPGATPMVVDVVRPDRGYRWHSTLGPWRLDYDNLVEPDGAGSVLQFTAELSGPMAGVIEQLVAPLSSLGQRRRMARLAKLAELIDSRS